MGVNKTTQQPPLSDKMVGFRFIRQVSSRSAWFMIIGVLCALVGAVYLYSRANQYDGGKLQDDAFPNYMQNIER